jgi:hypothetical protein
MTALTKILAGVAAEVGAVRKTERNNAQGFSFRGVDSVVNAVAGPLHSAGVFGPVPEVLDVQRTAGQSRGGGGLTRVVVTVRYTLYGPDDSLAGTVTAEAFDAGDKATAKAMSVALRTFLLQALCLPTDEPDPDQASYETAGVVEPLPSQRQAQARPSAPTVVRQWLTRHQMGHGEADALLAAARADGGATSPESLVNWLDANAAGGQR